MFHRRGPLPDLRFLVLPFQDPRARPLRYSQLLIIQRSLSSWRLEVLLCLWMTRHRIIVRRMKFSNWAKFFSFLPLPSLVGHSLPPPCSKFICFSLSLSSFLPAPSTTAKSANPNFSRSYVPGPSSMIPPDSLFLLQGPVPGFFGSLRSLCDPLPGRWSLHQRRMFLPTSFSTFLNPVSLPDFFHVFFP